MQPPHFLRLADFDRTTINKVVARATKTKQQLLVGQSRPTCRHKTLAMVFELQSTRTRVGFETAMSQLGGSAIFLSPQDTQLGRGEPVVDTARVLSQMVDVVMIRTLRQATIEAFAAAATVPVINGMSALTHPCQLLADVQTFTEHRGDIQGSTVAFIGDGYNMCHSYIEAAEVLDFKLNVATPATHPPDSQVMNDFGRNLSCTHSPTDAVRDADLVVTDVWSSLGHDDETDRLSAFEGFQVDEKLLDLAQPDALFFHCLPAHRGEEVNDSVLDDPRSLVFEEAGNRLHSQKALIEYLLGVAFD